MPAETDEGARRRQDILTAGLRCHYADGTRSELRPHCQQVASVARGSVVLCALCDEMRSAGRNLARPVPGAELIELVDSARDLTRAEERVSQGVRAARLAKASWAQIGDALGLSRQAAQQRFG